MCNARILAAVIFELRGNWLEQHEKRQERHWWRGNECRRLLCQSGVGARREERMIPSRDSGRCRKIWRFLCCFATTIRTENLSAMVLLRSLVNGTNVQHFLQIWICLGSEGYRHECWVRTNRSLSLLRSQNISSCDGLLSPSRRNFSSGRLRSVCKVGQNRSCSRNSCLYRYIGDVGESHQFGLTLCCNSTLWLKRRKMLSYGCRGLSPWRQQVSSSNLGTNYAHLAWIWYPRIRLESYQSLLLISAPRGRKTTRTCNRLPFNSTRCAYFDN